MCLIRVSSVEKLVKFDYFAFLECCYMDPIGRIGISGVFDRRGEFSQNHHLIPLRNELLRFKSAELFRFVELLEELDESVLPLP